MKRCPQCPEVYSDMMYFCPNDGSQLLTVAAQDPLIGNTIDGKYLIEEVIGKGGMGVVYRARHANFNRLFAIKVLKSELVNDPQAVKRFRNEANAAGAIRHPNAIAITDFNITSDGLAYLVMDYVEGRSLRDILKKEGPLDFNRIVNLISQVCDAVAAAHRKGIIHRDLKPDNIMVEKTEGLDEEMVHVLDFGIAKLSQNPAYSESITVGGAILGSPYYMSPEQCDGRQLDPRSDIYSIGIILYEMIAGKVPFRAQTPWGLVKMHCSTSPQPIRKHRPEVPPVLERAVLKALSKDSGERQQSAVELRMELEASLSQERFNQQPMEAPPAPLPVRPVKTEAPTAPLEDVKSAEPPSGEVGPPSSGEIDFSQFARPNAQADHINLLTRPMEALQQPSGQEVTGENPYRRITSSVPSPFDSEPLPTEQMVALPDTLEEQRELEALAKELEAGIKELRAGTGSIRKKASDPGTGSLREMAKELDEELKQFEPSARRSEIHHPPAQASAPQPQMPIFNAPYSEPNAAYGRQSALNDPTAPLSHQAEEPAYQSNHASASSYESIDLAEEFSLALPEMVEEVLMSVSETITLKGEVIARRAAQQAAAAPAPKGPGPRISPAAQQSRRRMTGATSKVTSSSAAAQDGADRSMRPADHSLRTLAVPPGSVERSVTSEEEFRGRLIKIGGASVGLILIISIILYFTREEEPQRPRGPVPRTAGQPAASQPTGLKTLPDGTVAAPEGMAYIAGGNFKMGSNGGDPCESPEREVFVKSFFMDKYEVTNRRYADFVESAGYKPPPQWQGGKYPDGQSDYPVTRVSWQDAAAYIEWRSRQTGMQYRLPTEAEWEYAARGSGGNPYPWGKDWKQNAANTKEANREGVVSVGTYRQGETQGGVSDLIGNAAEWTSDDLKPYPESRCKLPTGLYKVVRGGSFNTVKEKATATYRNWQRPAGDDYSGVGFRCVIALD